MNPKTTLPLFALVLALPLFSSCDLAQASSAEAATPVAARSEGGVAVVELFTSQGCSSCPPADRVLSKLAKDPAYAGRVVPLAFHVDYWNYIGWQDPFSDRRWSERQERYAQAYGTSRIYTPQLIVNGGEEMNGADERRVRRAIEKALATEPAARVTLGVRREGSSYVIQVEARHDGALVRDLEVWVALYQHGLSTAVGRGENARRTLENDSVVRRLERGFLLPAAAGASARTELRLAVDPAWPAGNLGIAAFAQDPKTKEIRGAAHHAGS